jgi:hypothetical protein
MSRARHTRQRQRIAPTTEAQAWLKDDYPEQAKQRIYLASRGAMHGPRRCLVCTQRGHATRVSIPPEALRIDRPTTDGIEVYWLCQDHCTQPPADGEIPGLLAARRRTRRG